MVTENGTDSSFFGRTCSTDLVVLELVPDGVQQVELGQRQVAVKLRRRVDESGRVVADQNDAVVVGVDDRGRGSRQASVCGH